ncbi:hypothetical protein LCGC14_2680020 [marine sediment metagenome]|uniref:Lipoprotein n=1 Tax=marine sediment metagenome TaxID=412755 RepID=A0A0F9CDC5_9ZZZZ
MVLRKAVMISFALLILLSACYHKDEDGRNASSLGYFVDPQTELCFASLSHGITHVPCTDKVNEQIRN